MRIVSWYSRARMRSKVIPRNAHASRAFRHIMENVRILFACPLKFTQCDFLGVFQLPSEFNMGFYPRTPLQPKYGRFFRQRQFIKD